MTNSYYEQYKRLRAMGLRASTAFGICKYGIDFLIALLIEEEIISSEN